MINHGKGTNYTCCITFTIILYFTFTGGVFVGVQGAVGLHRDDLRVCLL